MSAVLGVGMAACLILAWGCGCVQCVLALAVAARLFCAAVLP